MRLNPDPLSPGQLTGRPLGPGGTGLRRRPWPTLALTLAVVCLNMLLI
jgi:hypothetical protein